MDAQRFERIAVAYIERVYVSCLPEVRHRGFFRLYGLDKKPQRTTERYPGDDSPWGVIGNIAHYRNTNPQYVLHNDSWQNWMMYNAVIYVPDYGEDGIDEKKVDTGKAMDLWDLGQLIMQGKKI